MNKLERIEEFRKILASYQLSKEAKLTLAETELVLLVGPSSSGRNTIINELLTSGDYHNIISDTTRQKRTKDGIEIEKNGREYWFRDEDAVLEDLANGLFLEAAVIHNQQVSGISIREIEKAHRAGQIGITDIEPAGAEWIHELKPNAIFIFVLPPSFDEWMVRMRGRGELPSDEVRRRLQSAVQEIATALDKDYYHLVVNDTFKHAARSVDTIGRRQSKAEDSSEARKVALQLKKDIQAFLTEDGKS